MEPTPQVTVFNYIWINWLSRLNDLISRPEVITVEDSDMSNSWVKFDATRQPRYWKDAFGVVHLSGVVKNGTGMSTTVFTLPEGYRPSFVTGTGLLLPVVSNALFGYCTITDVGIVEASGGSTTYFSFDGITFKAA